MILVLLVVNLFKLWILNSLKEKVGRKRGGVIEERLVRELIAYLPVVKDLGEPKNEDDTETLKRIEEWVSQFTAGELVSKVEKAFNGGEIKESPDVMKRIEKMLAKAREQLSS